MRLPLIVLLCASTFAGVCSGGAFPSLLPDIARENGLRDWQLGVFAGAFGFARMLSDIPAGLFVARHLAAALVAGPVALVAGTLILASAHDFATLFVGRAVMGVGQALTMVASLTAILQSAPARRLGVALNAVEMSAMLGLMSGAALVTLLPRELPWKVVLLAACAPQVLAFVALPAIVAKLPRPGAPRPIAPATTPSQRSGTLVVLACAAGATLALSYASVEQFGIPVRGSREFGLDRGDIARIFMLMQACDAVALLPVGMYADRVGAIRVLAGVIFVLAIAVVLIGFAPLAGLIAGAVMFGFSMAGWMIPLSVLRRETPPALMAWRTALYRVGVDAGLFLGPVLGGLVANRHLAVVALALAVIGAWLLRADRARHAVAPVAAR